MRGEDSSPSCIRHVCSLPAKCHTNGVLSRDPCCKGLRQQHLEAYAVSLAAARGKSTRFDSGRSGNTTREDDDPRSSVVIHLKFLWGIRSCPVLRLPREAPEKGRTINISPFLCTPVGDRLCIPLLLLIVIPPLPAAVHILGSAVHIGSSHRFNSLFDGAASTCSHRNEVTLCNHPATRRPPTPPSCPLTPTWQGGSPKRKSCQARTAKFQEKVCLRDEPQSPKGGRGIIQTSLAENKFGTL